MSFRSNRSYCVALRNSLMNDQRRRAKDKNLRVFCPREYWSDLKGRSRYAGNETGGGSWSNLLKRKSQSDSFNVKRVQLISLLIATELFGWEVREVLRTIYYVELNNSHWFPLSFWLCKNLEILVRHVTKHFLLSKAMACADKCWCNVFLEISMAKDYF